MDHFLSHLTKHQTPYPTLPTMHKMRRIVEEMGSISLSMESFLCFGDGVIALPRQRAMRGGSHCETPNTKGSTIS